MSDAHRELGRRGEELVASRLEREGWRVLARNARPGGVRGELDLVCLDGDTLVFVEVKTRTAGSSRGPELPALAVGPRKQQKLRALAACWLRRNGAFLPPNRGLRFDVVGLRLDRAGTLTELDHLRAAF